MLESKVTVLNRFLLTATVRSRLGLEFTVLTKELLDLSFGNSERKILNEQS